MGMLLGYAPFREAMFSRESVNATEARWALHVVLRHRSNRPIRVDGHVLMPAMDKELGPMPGFAEGIRSGASLFRNLAVGGAQQAPAQSSQGARG